MKRTEQPDNSYVTLIDTNVASILARKKITYTSETFYAARSVFFKDF
jgi:hypothetical protein